MCGLRASSPLAVRGSGVSSRFSLSCVPSSCHLVVLAPRPACFVAPVVIALVPHARRHLPSPPHVLCSRHLCLSCVRSCPPPCSRVVSYRLSPRSFDELGGAFFACLPFRCGSRLLSRSLSCPAACLPHGGSLSSSPPLPVPLRLRSCLIVSRSLPLPVLRQAWAGRGSARYLLACSSLCSRLRLPRRACVRAGGLLFACLG